MDDIQTALSSKPAALSSKPAALSSKPKARSDPERRLVISSSAGVGALAVAAGAMDMLGDVPPLVGIALAAVISIWVAGLFVINGWATGKAVPAVLGAGCVLAFVGNLFEGFGGQVGLKVGSSALIFLMIAVVLVLWRSKPRWRTFQVGLLFLVSGLTAAMVYVALSLMFEDVIARIDESVLITVGPGILLVMIATATRRSLARKTRIIAASGVVALVLVVPLLFIVEWGVVVAGVALSISCGAWMHEARQPESSSE